MPEAQRTPSGDLEGSKAFGTSIHSENFPGSHQCQDAIRQGVQRSIVTQRPHLGAFREGLQRKTLNVIVIMQQWSALCPPLWCHGRHWSSCGQACMTVKKAVSFSTVCECLSQYSGMQTIFDGNHTLHLCFIHIYKTFSSLGFWWPKHECGVLSTLQSVTQWQVQTCLLLMKHRCSHKMSTSCVKTWQP